MLNIDLNNRELILIVDDEQSMRLLLRRMLESDGYLVDEADSGAQALKQYALRRPSIVLVDALMPGMTGFEFCAHMQKLPREEQMPAIMITALDDQASIDRAYEAGASDYVTKPIHWPVLRQRLRRLLRTERAERELEARHNLLRTLIDNIPDYIFVKDTQGHFLISNIAHAQLVGAESPAEEFGKTVHELFPADLALDYQTSDRAILESGQSLINLEQLTRDKAGNSKWVLTTKVPLRDHTGKIIGVVGVSRDITERKQAEQVIQRSEERFRSLVHNSSDLITVLAADGTIQYQSPSVEHILGYPPEEWLGKPIAAFAHPDDFAQARSVWAEIVQNPGKTFKFTYRFRHQDSSWRILEGTGKNLLDNPAVEGIVTNLHDVSDHKQIEESLLRSEAAEHEQRILAEALRETAAALASTLDLGAVMDQILISIGQVVPHDAANIMLIEGSVTRIVSWRGYPPAIEATLAELRLPLDAPGFQDMVDSCGPWLIDDTATNPKWVMAQKSEWIRSYVGAPIEVHGQIIGFLNLDSAQPGFFTPKHAERLQAFANQVGIAIENAHLYEELRRHTSQLEVRISERTRELNRAKEHVEAILNNSIDAILVIRNDGTISETNPACSDLFGYQPDEVIGTPLVTLIESGYFEQLMPVLASVRTAGTSKRIEVEARRKDGSAFYADVGLSPIVRSEQTDFSEEMPELVCSVRDITDRKQAERELQELSQLKTEFLSTAAHELRTPLASILGFSEILLTREMDAARNKRYIQIIHEQSIQLRKIIDSLLDISRIESRQGLTLDLQPVNIADLGTEILAHFSDYLPKYQFQLDGLSECPVIPADPFRLGQVFQNLLSNAVKYSPNGGDIIIGGRVVAGAVQVSVHDHGIGMTPEQQTHLFERFYRADASNTTLSGSGLGLAISKLIVELHGGRIWVDSEYNVGTTIFFTLPLAN
ncbi:MAG: PAS domain S-box protein [Aggregatilineales bacterium]